MADEDTQIAYDEEDDYTQEEQHDEQQEEDQEEEFNEDAAPEAEAEEEEESPEEPKQVKKKRERREVVEVAREPGKSLFPISRVQKIIKADKDIPIVAKEATYLIALATEEFIKRMCEASHHIASREKRSTVQHKDIATAVRKAEEFMFLEEILPWTLPEVPAAKRPRTKASAPALKGEKTMLDQFVVKKGAAAESDDEGDNIDVIMNEDGTMVYAAAAAAGGAGDDDDDDRGGGGGRRNY